MKIIISGFLVLVFSLTLNALASSDSLKLEGYTTLNNQKSYYTQLRIQKTKVISEQGNVESKFIGSLSLLSSKNKPNPAIQILFDKVKKDQNSGEWILFYQGPSPTPSKGILNISIVGSQSGSGDFQGQIISNQLLPDGESLIGQMSLS